MEEALNEHISSNKYMYVQYMRRSKEYKPIRYEHEVIYTADKTILRRYEINYHESYVPRPKDEQLREAFETRNLDNGKL